MRPCTYTVARHGPRRQKQSTGQSQDGHDETISAEAHANMVINEDKSPTSTLMQSAARDNTEGRVSTSPNDSLMTTVVSNGNDALNLLFEAVQREEHDDSNPHLPTAADEHSIDMTVPPILPMTSFDATSLPEISNELTDTWNAYRFVRMGWLSAAESVWLLDMFVQAPMKGHETVILIEIQVLQKHRTTYTYTR